MRKYLLWLTISAFVVQAWIQSPCFQTSIDRRSAILLSAADSKRQREQNKDKVNGNSFRRIGMSFSSKKKEEPPEEEEPGFFGKLLKRNKEDEAVIEKAEPKKNLMSRMWSNDKNEQKDKKEKKKSKSWRQRKLRKEKAKAPKKAEVSESRAIPLQGLFNRTREEEPKQSTERRPQNQKAKVAPLEKKEERSDSRGSGLQALFNNTKSGQEEEKLNKAKSRNTTSPLSVVQKFVSNLWGSSNEEWVPVFPKTRISPGEVVPATIAGIDLLVIASKDARKLYCIANSCPHLGTPLETGKLVRLPVENPTSTPLNPLQPPPSNKNKGAELTEMEVSNILQQDGCEDCIVCPLHKTAFALESGQVRGEWCPYPPVLGKVMGAYKQKTSAAVFDVRYRGKNVEVRINSPIDS